MNRAAVLALALVVTFAGVASARCRCCSCINRTRTGWAKEAHSTTPANAKAPERADSKSVIAWPFKYEVYRDEVREYRWRLKAANGRVIADSGEGYKNKSDCLHGIDLVRASAASAVVVDQ